MQLVPLRVGPLSPDEIAEACNRLHDRGVIRVLSPALAPNDRPPFLAAEFVVHEELHLLRLEPGPAAVDRPPVRTRRAKRRDMGAVLDADHAAFERFWQLGRDGIEEAVAATPQSRFRVIDRPVSGYCIAGCAGRRGYIQRLAVHPAHQGLGLGRSLLVDALSWMRRRTATSVLVNTQVSNARALDLYRRAGFRLQEHGLAVLVHEAGQ